MSRRATLLFRRVDELRVCGIEDVSGGAARV